MAKAKRRLSNIRTRELSIVDEAANLRRFIIVKRKGGSSMGKKNAELLTDDEKPVLKLAADVKQTLIDQSNEVIEKLKAAVADIEKIEVAEDASGDVPGELIEKFDAVHEAFPKFAGDEDEDDFGIDVMKKVAEEVKKAGKKISAGRLAKINDAVSILSGLLTELTGSTGGDSSTQKTATSNEGSHEGGSGMATQEETKKRSPDAAFKLAEAELIKAREVMEEAEGNADKDAVAKAKADLEKAQSTYDEAKAAFDEDTKKANIAKAEKEAEEAAERVRKAKGETEGPKGENAEVLKSILDGQKKLEEKLEATTAENAELKKKLEEVAKTSQPSNSSDGADETPAGDDKEVDKNKDVDAKFWGGIF